MTNLEIKKLNFQYKDLNIFSGFSFNPSGRFNLLKGHSGCGKTTLLKIIFGEIEVDNEKHVLKRPKRCYLILQDDALLPWLTGTSNIELVNRENEMPIYLKELSNHINSFQNKKAYEMSFGQRRLIELHRALLFCPDLLLLDEPFNYLDTYSRKVVSHAINQYLFSNQKAVILMTSHYLELNEILQPRTYLFKGQQPYKTLILDEK